MASSTAQDPLPTMEDQKSDMEMMIEDDRGRDDVTISRMDFRLKFFIGIFHTILYERGHLPEDAFIFSQIFEVDVPICVHTRVFEYIESCAKKIACLMETRTLDGFVFNLLYDTQVVQRYVFKVSEIYNLCTESEANVLGSTLLEMTETARSILIRFKERLVDVHRHKYCEFARFQIVVGLNPSGIKAVQGGCWSDEEWNPFPWSKMFRNKIIYVPPSTKNGSLGELRPKNVTLDVFPKTPSRTQSSNSFKKPCDHVQQVYIGDYNPLSIRIYVLTYFNIDNLDLLTANTLNAPPQVDPANPGIPLNGLDAASKPESSLVPKQPSLESSKIKPKLPVKIPISTSSNGSCHKPVSSSRVLSHSVSNSSGTKRSHSSSSDSNKRPSKSHKSEHRTSSSHGHKSHVASTCNGNSSKPKSDKTLSNGTSSATVEKIDNISSSSADKSGHSRSKSSKPAKSHHNNGISSNVVKNEHVTRSVKPAKSDSDIRITSSPAAAKSDHDHNIRPLKKSKSDTDLTNSSSSPSTAKSGHNIRPLKSIEVDSSNKSTSKLDKGEKTPSPSPPSSPLMKKPPKYSISFSPAAGIKSKIGSPATATSGPKITYRAAPFTSPPILTRKFAKLRSRSSDAT